MKCQSRRNCGRWTKIATRGRGTGQRYLGDAVDRPKSVYLIYCQIEIEAIFFLFVVVPLRAVLRFSDHKWPFARAIYRSRELLFGFNTEKQVSIRFGVRCVFCEWCSDSIVLGRSPLCVCSRLGRCEYRMTAAQRTHTTTFFAEANSTSCLIHETNAEMYEHCAHLSDRS